MIRPLTIATCLLACGSGLYLYQSKHEVQLLDRTIERNVHGTAALREQSRLLAAEWTMLNDPERLRQFSDTYLNLKTITPSQFTSLTDLDNRLPAPRTDSPAPGPHEQELVPITSETAPSGPSDAAPVVASHESLPVPPIPATPPGPVIASTARPNESKAPDRGPVFRPVVAENQVRPVAVASVRPPEQRQAPEQRQPAEQRQSAEQRQVDPRSTPRSADAHGEIRTTVAPPMVVPAAPRPMLASAPVSSPVSALPAPVPVAAPPRPAVVAAAAPYNGSLLGMARSSMSPAPRPMPVNTTYNSN